MEDGDSRGKRGHYIIKILLFTSDGNPIQPGLRENVLSDLTSVFPASQGSLLENHSFSFSLSLFHSLPSSPAPPWVHSQADSPCALAKKASRTSSLTPSWHQTHRTERPPLSQHPNWSPRCTLIGSVWVTCPPLNQSPGWRDGML